MATDDASDKKIFKDWTTQDVVNWLKSKGFNQDVCNMFIEKEIRGSHLHTLDVTTLKHVGITACNTRCDIETGIKEQLTKEATSKWDTFHDILLSKFSSPIPPEFKVAAKGSVNHAIMTRPPARFDLHLPSLAKLHYVKWAPYLVEEGMKKLKDLHPRDAPSRDPGDNFWMHHDINNNAYALGLTMEVMGERDILRLAYSDFLDPICNIMSRILFHLNEDPLERQYGYFDFNLQFDPDFVVKLSGANEIDAIIAERIVYALVVKSLTVAPSSFFFRLCSRAAANTPDKFPGQSCVYGTACRHAKSHDTLRYVGPVFFNDIERRPAFNPSTDEFQKLLNSNCLIDDDHADNSGRTPLDSPDIREEYSKKPRAHVALAILRTGAVALDEDTTDAPVAQALAGQTSPRSKGHNDTNQEPREEFEEHYMCVLQRLWSEMVHHDLTFAALTTLKHAVMVYRSRVKQTLFVSTPFHPGASSPTFSQALLSQIVSAYQEAKDREQVAHTDKGPERLDNDQGKDGPGRHGDHNDGGSSIGAKRKGNEHEPYPNKVLRDGSVSDDNKIPNAILSAKEQLRLSKSLRIGETYMCIHDGYYDSEVSALLKPVDGSSRPGSPPSSPVPSMTRSAPTSSDSSMESPELLSSAETTSSSLCLTQKLGRSDTWKGVYANSTIVLDVVAKVGWFDDAREQFVQEAKIYDILQKHNINGVPVLVGLFDDIDDQVPILVTTYAGPEISTFDEPLKKQFRQILQDLHKIGICHGDLRQEIMCCLDGRGSIIDFDRASETRVGDCFREDVLALEQVLAGY